MDYIYVFLITGFEEIEAVATVDILRRAGLEVRTVSLTDSLEVIGAHGIPVRADVMFADAQSGNARMLVLPGGTPAYNAHEGVRAAVEAFYLKGGIVAAICASPMVLGSLGILRGREATCYPGFEKYLDGATLRTDRNVVVDGNVVTGRGPGLTPDFALTLVELAAGRAARDNVAAGLLLD